MQSNIDIGIIQTGIKKNYYDQYAQGSKKKRQANRFKKRHPREYWNLQKETNGHFRTENIFLKFKSLDQYNSNLDTVEEKMN